MGYRKKTTEPTKWVTVAIDAGLHGEVRAEGCKLGKPWPVIAEEAIRMWLIAQRGLACPTPADR